MDRRRNRRVTALIPVRVWGVDSHAKPFTQHAKLKNISGSGAVLQGVVRQVKPGETIHVQVDKVSAQFRVIWVGKSNTSRQGEMGVQTLPSEPCIWDINPEHCGESAGRG